MADLQSSIVHRRNGKSAAAFRTISEVADDLEVPPHILRFWETKFNQVRPLKRGGGRRYYRPEDVALLQRNASQQTHTVLRVTRAQPPTAQPLKFHPCFPREIQISLQFCNSFL